MHSTRLSAFLGDLSITNQPSTSMFQSLLDALWDDSFSCLHDSGAQCTSWKFFGKVLEGRILDDFFILRWNSERSIARIRDACSLVDVATSGVKYYSSKYVGAGSTMPCAGDKWRMWSESEPQASSSSISGVSPRILWYCLPPHILLVGTIYIANMIILLMVIICFYNKYIYIQYIFCQVGVCTRTE
jgi:hypothetical protein